MKIHVDMSDEKRKLKNFDIDAFETYVRTRAVLTFLVPGFFWLMDVMKFNGFIVFSICQFIVLVVSYFFIHEKKTETPIESLD